MHCDRSRNRLKFDYQLKRTYNISALSLYWIFHHQHLIRNSHLPRVPEIVFWNLRNSSSTPVVATQNGVAMVSGFSKNLLTLFLEEGGIVNPEQVMELAIAGEEYKKLAVYD